MLKYAQNDRVQCFTSPSSPLNTSFSFFAICRVESSGKTNLSGGGQLASGAVMVGPPGSLLYLARLSPMLGICSALGDLS